MGEGGRGMGAEGKAGHGSGEGDEEWVEGAKEEEEVQRSNVILGRCDPYI